MNAIIQPKLVKGFRDMSVSDMIQRQFVLDKIRSVVESFGFGQIETPTVEYRDILLGNIGEDEKLIFHFIDDGGRNVALRYDQTVGACRYIAMNYHELALPFKRYQIQTAFRAENTQKGRYREFLQFDADIFGVDTMGADLEMILLTCAIYKKLGFSDYKVMISDRALVADIPYPILASIDKIDKIGREGVLAEIARKGFDEGERMLDYVLNMMPNERIQYILDHVIVAGYGDHVVFDPSIMRSFSYSTGTIWEVRVEQYQSSLLGGERFDSLVSRFSKEHVSGVGFGLGFDRTVEAMGVYDLLPHNQTKVALLMSIYSGAYIDMYIKMASKARESGINTEIYTIYTDKLAKQFKYADKKGIRFVITVGEEEVKEDIVSFKDLKTGFQERMSFSEAIDRIKENI